MPRLAWFSPVPPDRSGIAAYNAELLPLLADTHAIDVFVGPDAEAGSGVQASGSGYAQSAQAAAGLRVPIHRSRDFPWRHRACPYDLVVYQMGNSPCHDYMWPYLVRFPGLVVLHDAQLHHSRSRKLLSEGRRDEYRAEFAFCHPDANPAVAELIVQALGGCLYFLWPLNRVPLDCARLVAVHSDGLAAELREAHPEQDVAVIEMGVADPVASTSAREASDVRARHAIPGDRLVMAAFGRLTPEKRLSPILKALRGVLPYAPNIHVMLVGQPVDYYDVEADARAIGVAEQVTVTGYVDDRDLPAYFAAADVCLCLRWPSSRETSAAWLRCLAAGKPTITTDLVHTALMPALDPRTWTMLSGDAYAPPASESGGSTAGESRGPICVAIDIVDELHSLVLAMRRLARDEPLRRDLGGRAREHWRRHHTLERMAEGYRRAIEAALGRPAPDRSHLPSHLLADGTGRTRRIVEQFGLGLDALGWKEGAGT